MPTFVATPSAFTVYQAADTGDSIPQAVAFTVPGGQTYTSGVWHLEGTIYAPYNLTGRIVTASGSQAPTLPPKHNVGFYIDEIAVTATQLAALNALSAAGGGTYNATVEDTPAVSNIGVSPVAVDGYTLVELIMVMSGGCSYSIAPTSSNQPAAGATGQTFAVTTGGGCAWTAVAVDLWLHVTGGSSGTGNGTVTYSVDANGGGPRTGTINAAFGVFTVNQAGVIGPPPPQPTAPVYLPWGYGDCGPGQSFVSLTSGMVVTEQTGPPLMYVVRSDTNQIVVLDAQGVGPGNSASFPGSATQVCVYWSHNADGSYGVRERRRRMKRVRAFFTGQILSGYVVFIVDGQRSEAYPVAGAQSFPNQELEIWQECTTAMVGTVCQVAFVLAGNGIACRDIQPEYTVVG